ncbi:MAG: maleylpyruvate isomerase family mycothiol-dependent enzyme [Actinomycetota bacterium]
MPTRERIADELRSERQALTTYLESLPEAAWDKQSLCEGWTVKDVMAHVVGIASDVANRRLDGVGTDESNQRQVDDRKASSPREILHEWNAEGKLLEDGIGDLDDEFWNAPYTDNFTVGDALQRMVEDIWTHGQDIRIPLGDDTTSSPALTSTLEVIARDMFNRLPITAPSVGTVHITAGDFSATVNGPGAETVTVSGDAITLGLVGTGRIALDDAISDGKVKVSPNVPEGLAQAINIYGT